MAKTDFMKMFERLCAEHGLSVRGACLKIGISTATPTNWKNGALPTAAVQQKIADYFNISIDDLMQRNIEGMESPISEEELELLNAFGKLDDEDKKIAMRIINLLSKE